MIVLDTTVLAYAAGSEHRYRDPCRVLVRAVGQREVQATTTIEAIQELAHVRARRRPRADAVALARSYAELLSPLLVVTQADLARGLELFAGYPRLGAFDAVLLAAAETAGARALVSADAAFAAAGTVAHVLPDEAGVARLLGAD